jgi:hypothetical protein
MEEMMTLHRPDEERGSLADIFRTVVAGEAVDLGFEGDLTFEQVMYLLHMGVKAVTPTQPDAVNSPTVYLWTYTPSLTSGNTPKTFTIEYGDDVQEHEVEYCVAKELEFSGALDEPLVMKATIFGRNLEASTFTAGLSDPSLESALMNKTKLYIDDVGGTIGTTEKSATLIDFSWKLTTGFVPRKHGGAQLYFDSLGELKKKVTVDMTFEFNSGAEIERTKYAAGTRRLFRLKSTGTNIEDAYNRELTLDFAGVYTKFGTLEENDGADIVKVTIESEYDSGWGKLFEVTVQNDVSSLT